MKLRTACAALALGSVSAMTGTATAGDVETLLPVINVTTTTGEKPQSKVWQHAGFTWTVLDSTDPSPAGVWVFRLNKNDTFTPVLRIDDGGAMKADAKTVGNVTHILLHELEGASARLVSIQHVMAGNTYQIWPGRPTTTTIDFDGPSETAVIDVDSTGKMWLAVDNSGSMQVYHADPPYSAFSGPITLATGAMVDDIATVASLPTGETCFIWTDQNARRFGCRVHQDGDAATVWGPDEEPGVEGADDNLGVGLADDHLHATVGSDGSIYLVVKTGFNTFTFPDVALLVRRPSAGIAGASPWDAGYYFIEQDGTRGVASVNEVANTIRVYYKQDTEFDMPNVVYRDASLDDFEFGGIQVMIRGGAKGWNDPSTMKTSWIDETMTLASDEIAGEAVGLRHESGIILEGACCHADGSCTVGPEADCTVAEGTYQGHDVDCTDSVCTVPVNGACCFLDGSCTFVTPEACTTAGGKSQGLGVSCAEAACVPQLPVACCFVTTCIDLFEADCLANGGSANPQGSECASFTCTAPPCAADVNGDNIVDVLDLVAVISGWGLCGSACSADITLDGIQDVQDLILVIQQWGPCL